LEEGSEGISKAVSLKWMSFLAAFVFPFLNHGNCIYQPGGRQGERKELVSNNALARNSPVRVNFVAFRSPGSMVSLIVTTATLKMHADFIRLPCASW